MRACASVFPCHAGQAGCCCRGVCRRCGYYAAFNAIPFRRVSDFSDKITIISLRPWLVCLLFSPTDGSRNISHRSSECIPPFFQFRPDPESYTSPLISILGRAESCHDHVLASIYEAKGGARRVFPSPSHLSPATRPSHPDASHLPAHISSTMTATQTKKRVKYTHAESKLSRAKH